MMSYFIGLIFVALALVAFFVEMFWPSQPVNGMFRPTHHVDGMLSPPPAAADQRHQLPSRHDNS